MVTSTSYHAYQKPTPNEDDDQWGSILNDTIDDLDVDVVEKGPIANRPSAGTQDRWYVATDASPFPELSYDSGTQWQGMQVENTQQLGGVSASSYARTDTAETFGSAVSFSAPIDVSAPADQLVLIDSDSSIDVNDEWRVSHEDGELAYTFYDDSAASVLDGLTVGSGGVVRVPNGSFTQGRNPATTITETTTPKSFNFTGDDTRDIHDQTDVTISNSSGASATEDITVDLYDGTDTTGTLLVSETQSITVADTASTTATFIAGDLELDNGTYHLEVTQSGTALTIDQTDESTKGATYEFGQSVVGDFYLRNQDGTDILTADAITEDVFFSGATVDFGGGELRNVPGVWSDAAGGGQLRFDGAADASFQTSGSGTGHNAIYDIANNQPIAKFNEGGNVEVPNGTLSIQTNQALTTASTSIDWADYELQKNGAGGTGTINFIT